VGDHDEEFRELSALVQLVGSSTITQATLADTSHGFVTDESMARLLALVADFVGTVDHSGRKPGTRP
jgi:hypothetical protein